MNTQLTRLAVCQNIIAIFTKIACFDERKGDFQFVGNLRKADRIRYRGTSPLWRTQPIGAFITIFEMHTKSFNPTSPIQSEPRSMFPIFSRRLCFVIIFI